MLGLGISQSLYLVVYLLGIIVALIALFYDVKVAFLFLLILLPLQNIIVSIRQLPLGSDFVDILLAVVTIVWASKSLGKREKIFENTSLNPVLFILIVFTYFSLWQGSLSFGLSLPVNISDPRVRTWKNYIILPLLYFITVNNIKDKKWIKLALIAIAFTILMMGLQFFNNCRWMDKTFYRNEMRQIGTFAFLGPNEYAAFHVQYLFVLLGIFFFDKVKIHRIFLGVAIAVSLYCVLFSYSRGAYIAALAGIMFISGIKKRVLLIPLIILLIFWQVILPRSVVERINMSRTEEGDLENSSQLRVIMWQESIGAFQESPITGKGFNVTPHLGLALGDTHNMYVKVLVEQGIIGMIIFLSILWRSFKNAWFLYKNSKDSILKGLGLGFATCVIVTMVTNIFGDRWTYIQLGAYFWVFLGLVTRAGMLNETEAVVASGNSNDKKSSFTFNK